MSSSLPTALAPESCVLFLGSGFTAEAKNIADTHPPVGDGLAKEIIKALENEADDLDLKSLSDELYYQSPDDLYNLLYNLFTISELSESQKTILSKRWLRIFTTNYDDAVEVGVGKGIPSYSYSDPIPKRVETGSIVHIHGDIRHATVANVTEQLVLNENSYIRQHFEKSPWYTDFDRALDHCTYCFFVGYSVKDYHITSLLMQKAFRKSKTFFINRSLPSKSASRQMEQFGQLHPIGTDGFADLCRTLPRPAPISDLNSLRLLKRIDPFRDKKAVSPPTKQEILRMVTYGEFNTQRCITNLPGAEYVSPREESASAAVRDLRNAKTLIVHSYLGNGKTTFLTILSYFLKTEGYEVFECKANSALLTQELNALSKIEKLVIIIDSYDLAILVVSHANNLLPTAKFVVSVRTGNQDVRFHEIHEKLPKPIARVSLNKLETKEKDQFEDLLDKAGILDARFRPNFKIAKDFRELVTTVYNHQGIQERISAEVRPLLLDQETRDVFIASILMSWLGHALEPSLLKAVTGLDPFVALRKHEAVSREIFKIDEDSIEARSPIFSEYILKKHVPPADLINIIEKIILSILPRKYERGLVGLLSKIMRVSSLASLIEDKADYKLIHDAFERLSRDRFVNLEPLFWLQYSILITETEIMTAEYYIKTAYSRAEDIENFKTYQIDTYHVKLLLLIEAGEIGEITRYDEIIDKLDLIVAMISDDSHRSHAVKVLENIAPFVSARRSSMSISERSGLVFQLNRVVTALGQLPLEKKTETGSDIVKNSINESIRIIVE